MIEFPPAFISFLKDNIEYISELDKPIQRTIRVKEGIGLSDLQKDLKTSDISKVDWFSNCFYQLDASIRLASSALYENGLIYGMDITSAVAVAALSISPNDHVLDLCCAPGAKTCYISELLGTSGTGTVTGVDLSKERLSICKSLARKYKLEKYRLFHADGTTFDICAPSRIGSTILMVCYNHFIYLASSVSAWLNSKTVSRFKTD
jgi:16S rRNA C967 or C1407 C5-methylase (RsmB/RsmF family)